MAIYTRESDGEVLDLSSPIGTIDRFLGAYDLSTPTEFSYGELAEAREISSYIEQKTFTIDLIFSDTSGSSQLTVLSFFRKGGKYVANGPEFSLSKLGFYVVAIDTKFFEGGTDVVTLTCQAEFGDFIEETETLIDEWTGTGAYPGFSGSFSNPASEIATIRVEIEKASADSLWNPSISFKLNGITITTGAFGPTGVLEAAAGKRILIDSYSEILEGPAVISPMAAAFFRVRPGASTTVTITPFSGLTAEPMTVRVYGYSIARAA